MTSKYFKPYLDQLGDSNKEMRAKGKITKPERFRSHDRGYRDDNGPVAFGEAFKWLKG